MGEPGYFPVDEPLRVLWVGVENVAPVQVLHRRIMEALENGDIIAFSRRDLEHFTPHLTLARIKNESLRPQDAKALKREIKRTFGDFPEPLEEPWKVDGLQLIRSELQPGGSRYSVLGEFPFMGKP